MRRHPIDPFSAALGVVMMLIAAAVMIRGADGLVTGGPWWLAIAAIVLGIGLIPWHTPRHPSHPAGDDRPDRPAHEHQDLPR